MKGWMIDGCIRYDLCIMRVKLSHPRALIPTTHRRAQSDWQLLFRTILTCMLGPNYTPGTLWHCEVTSLSSLIWWQEQSTFPSSLWYKVHFCIDDVAVCHESVYAGAHITGPPSSFATVISMSLLCLGRGSLVALRHPCCVTLEWIII